MKPLNWGAVVIYGLIGLVVGVVLSLGLLLLGKTPLIVTPWLALLFLIVGIALWVAGREVRRLKQKKSTRITAIQASRVAFFARSAVINGAVFTGLLGGLAAASATRLWAPAMAAGALGAGIAAVASLAMTCVAALVERWCIDGSTDDPSDRWGRPAGGDSDAGPKAARP